MSNRNDKLYENLYNAGTDPAKVLAALGPLLVALFPAQSATPQPKPSELEAMGLRNAGSNEDQAMVNIRLGYSADLSRRLWSPEEIALRLKSWGKVKDRYLAIGLQENLAEYGYLAGWPEFMAVESFVDLSGYLSNYIGLTLHDKLLSDLSQPGHASGGGPKG